MAALESSASTRSYLFWLFVSCALFALAGQVSASVPWTTLTLALGFVVLIVAFWSTEAAIYILIFSMLLSPEFGATEGGISERRSVTIRAEDVLILLIGFSWFARTAIQKELGLFPHTSLNRPIIAYICACIFSTALGIMVGRVESLSGIFYVLKYIEFFIIFFMIVNHVYSEKQARSIVMVALITCAAVSVYGILQIPGGGRVSAPFEGQSGEPNTFGGYLVLMMSVVLGLYLNSTDRRTRRWLLILAGLMVIPLLFTLSRGSWAAVGGMYITLIIFSERRTLMIGVGVLIAIIAPQIMPQQVTMRAINTFMEVPGYSATEILGGIPLDPSASARVTTNKMAFESWLENPIWGYGITGSGLFLDSQFFRTLVELGAIGLAAFVWLLWMALKIGKYGIVHGRSEFTKGLSTGYVAGTVGLLVHGIFSTTFIIVRIMEPFWLLTAVVLLLPTLENAEAEVEKEMPAGRDVFLPGLSLATNERIIKKRRIDLLRDLVRSQLKDRDG